MFQKYSKTHYTIHTFASKQYSQLLQNVENMNCIIKIKLNQSVVERMLGCARAPPPLR